MERYRGMNRKSLVERELVRAWWRGRQRDGGKA